MPLSVAKRNRLYRLVEPGGSLATTVKGSPVDGGGHASKAKAESQRRAIDASKRRTAPMVVRG